uniref:Uncharacterized protein n=1 Tax=Glossina palpalis gambiensis TaxID=67801 RepID=A0A1B0C117_9MUSC
MAVKETDLLRLDKTLLLLLSVAAGNAESLASNIRLLFPSLLTDSDLRKSSGSKCSNFAWKSGRGDDICLLSTTASVGIEDNTDSANLSRKIKGYEVIIEGINQEVDLAQPSSYGALRLSVTRLPTMSSIMMLLPNPSVHVDVVGMEIPLLCLEDVKDRSYRIFYGLNLKILA